MNFRLSRPSIRSGAFLALVVLSALLLNGCACFNRKNTPLLNSVEDHLWPESTVGRVAAFPVLLPVGFVAACADAFVVHPAYVVDDALEDTQDVLWDDFEWEDKYVTECAVLPWRALFSPIVFSVDFLARAYFDIPERAREEREGTEGATPTPDSEALFEKPVREAEALLKEGKSSEAFDRLRGESVLAEAGWEFRSRASYILVRAALEAHRLRDLHHVRPWDRSALLDYADRAAMEALLVDMRRVSDPLERWAAFKFQLEIFRHRNLWAPLTEEGLGDENPVLRSRVLDWLDNLAECCSDYPRIVEKLRAVADNDPEAMNRALAAEILKKTK